MLEFDCEAALLQSSFLTMQQLYGKDLLSMDYNDLEKCRPLIRRTYLDILQIRNEEKVSELEQEHRNRKLTLGLLYSRLRNKYNWTLLRSPFESFNNVYPPFNWKTLIMFIEHCNLSSWFAELLFAMNENVTFEVVWEILPSLSDCKQSKHVLVLTDLLSKLMSSNIKTWNHSQCKELVMEILTMIRTHICNYYVSWRRNVKRTFIISFSTLLVNALKLLQHPRNAKGIVPKLVTLQNLEKVHREIKLGDYRHLADIEVERIVDLLTLCFNVYKQVFGTIDWEELVVYERNFCVKYKIRKGAMSRIIQDLANHCNEAYMPKKDASEEEEAFATMLCHTYKQLNACSLLETKPPKDDAIEDPTEIINDRLPGYRDVVQTFIKSNKLVYKKHWIDCLQRNVDLIGVDDTWELINHIKNKNLTSPNVQGIKLVIMGSFMKWPLLLKQDFLVKYLKMNISILETASFDRDLTVFFNTLTKVDTELMIDLERQFLLLCLQSPRKTLNATIVQATHNDKQADVIAKLLLSASLVCRFRTLATETSLLCKVINQCVMTIKSNSIQTQNLKLLIQKMLQETQPNASLKAVELLHSCCLPFMDQWNPQKHSPETILALQLLKICLAEPVSSKSSWLREVRPCVLLSYLGIIIYQCKLVSCSKVTDWISLKSSSIEIIQQLKLMFLDNPSLIPEKELQWLVAKLTSINETLLFHFVDYLEFYNSNVSFRGTNDPLAYLLEFAACSDKNTQAAIQWFKQIADGFQPNTWAHIIASLTKVLPTCVESEWVNIVKLLKQSIDNQSTNNTDSCFSSAVSEDYLATVRLISILEKTLILCSSVKPNINYMLHCFTICVKDIVLKFLTFGVDSEDDILMPAEVFVTTCRFLKQLPIEYHNAGSILLLDLAKQSKQLEIPKPQKTLAKMRQCLMSLPPHEMQPLVMDALEK